jgi:hypothetical protein
LRGRLRSFWQRSTREPEVVGLVPAFNEAARVAQTVEGLLRIPQVGLVLVIDDGSRDATAERAVQAGASCIRLSRNSGKGAALNAGICTLRSWTLLSRHVPPDVLIADADLGGSAFELAALIEPVRSGRADLAIGDLPPQNGAQGFGVAMRLARWVLGCNGAAFNEPLSGQRMLSWKAVEVLWPFAKGFGVEIAMSLRAVAADLRVVEIPVEVHHRATRKDVSGLMHRARQARAIMREGLLHQVSHYSRAFGSWPCPSFLEPDVDSLSAARRSPPEAISCGAADVPSLSTDIYVRGEEWRRSAVIPQGRLELSRGVPFIWWNVDKRAEQDHPSQLIRSP